MRKRPLDPGDRGGRTCFSIQMVLAGAKVCEDHGENRGAISQGPMVPSLIVPRSLVPA